MTKRNLIGLFMAAAFIIAAWAVMLIYAHQKNTLDVLLLIIGVSTFFGVYITTSIILIASRK